MNPPPENRQVVARLEFIVPGRVVSANGKTRFSNGHAHVSPKTKAYQAHVAACAMQAAVRNRWQIPACARVTFTIWNTTVDWDNAIKCALDGLKGIAIVDDQRKHCRGGGAEHDLDDGGPRLTIRVEPCDPCAPVAKKKAPRRTGVRPKGRPGAG